MRIVSTGSGTSDSRVSRASIRHMRNTVITKVVAVLAKYMIPGPSRSRTPSRSFVARDMRSPTLRVR